MIHNTFTLSQQLGLALKAQGKVLALAESCTGGGLAYEITAVSGSSAWFDRGFVTYSDRAKMDLLGVSAATLQAYGAVSEPTAMEMAAGALAHSAADIALSITGVAGPTGGTLEKPVGTVWFGLAMRDGMLEAVGQHFTSGRREVRRQAVIFALQRLIQALVSN